MPIENIEVVLVFLIAFVMCSILIYFFQELTKNFHRTINAVFLDISKKNIELCLNFAEFINNSSIFCSLSKINNIEVFGKGKKVEIRNENYIAIIETPYDVNGYSTSTLQIFNINGSIYIT